MALTILLVLPACSGDDTPDADGSAAPTETTTAVDPALDGLPGGDGASVNEQGIDPLPPLPDDVALPIVFVHGFAGSAQQYESQAMRFVANGYPQDRIVAYEHDGAGVDIPATPTAWPRTIDAALAEFGAEQVYLVGHSRGTSVSSTVYLGDPGARGQGRQVRRDRRRAVRRRRAVPRADPGANSRASRTSRSRRRRSRSPRSTSSCVGEAPEVVDIVPQRDPVVISGPSGELPGQHRPGGRHARHLGRSTPTPARASATSRTRPFVLDADGAFGPFIVESGAHYE